MNTTESTASTRGFVIAVVGTIIPAILVLGLFASYVAYVPRYKRMFDEFGLTLPWITLVVIRVSNWVAGYWWAIVPLLAVAGAGNFMLLNSLARRGWVAPVTWAAGVSLLLVAIIAATVYAVEAPTMKLMEGLAK